MTTRPHYTTRDFDAHTLATSGHEEEFERTAQNFVVNLFRYIIPLSLALWGIIIGLGWLIWQVVR